MRKSATLVTLALITLLVVALGRAAEDKSDLSALQGTWKGKEIGNDDNNACRLIITGNNLEYRGVEPNDWVKGTLAFQEGKTPRQFIATFTDCADADSIGKTCVVIYKIENGVLTVAGNKPGSTDAPAGFDDSGARRFEFKKQ